MMWRGSPNTCSSIHAAHGTTSGHEHLAFAHVKKDGPANIAHVGACPHPGTTVPLEPPPVFSDVASRRACLPITEHGLDHVGLLLGQLLGWARRAAPFRNQSTSQRGKQFPSVEWSTALTRRIVRRLSRML